MNTEDANSALDDEYNDLRELKISENRSEMLNVHMGQWQTHLQQCEQTDNVGCLALFFFGFLVTSTYDYTSLALYIFLICLLVGIIFFFANPPIYRKLQAYGNLEYEIANDRIVVYTPMNYQIFLFEDVQRIQHKRYGLVFRMKKEAREKAKQTKRTQLDRLVVPSKLQSYTSVVKFLKIKFPNTPTRKGLFK